MEASIEIETRRLEGWRQEISRLRLKSLSYLVAILAGVALVVGYVAVNHGQNEIVFFLSALAFLVLAQMLDQIRVMRFIEKDILSRVLWSRSGGLSQ